MTDLDDKETICPLCGADNQCAMAAGQAAESCWCQAVEFDAKKLEAIPDESKNKHCICLACGAVTEDPSLAR